MPVHAMDYRRIGHVASWQGMQPVTTVQHVRVVGPRHQAHVPVGQVAHRPQGQAGNQMPAARVSQAPVSLGAEIEKFMKVHNDIRAQLGVGPLVWDEGLARYALQWAQELARTNSFKHRPNNRFGENLFWGSGANFTFEQAAKAWASEKPLMHGKKYTPGAGHYSQMIWRNTRRVGAAAVRYGNKIVIVANYDPAGNYIGQDAY